MLCAQPGIYKYIVGLSQDLDSEMHWAWGLEPVVSTLSCANLLIPCLTLPLAVLQTSKRRWVTDKRWVDGKPNAISMWPLQSRIWSISKWSRGPSRHSDRRALSRSCLGVSERSDASKRGIPPGSCFTHSESVTGHFVLLILLHYLSEITAYLQGKLCLLLVIRRERKSRDSRVRFI